MLFVLVILLQAEEKVAVGGGADVGETETGRTRPRKSRRWQRPAEGARTSAVPFVFSAGIASLTTVLQVVYYFHRHSSGQPHRKGLLAFAYT